MEELQRELAEMKETMVARMQEMNELSERNADLCAKLEKAKMDVSYMTSSSGGSKTIFYHLVFEIHARDEILMQILKCFRE